MSIKDVTHGSHSTRTTYVDGRVEFVSHWDALLSDVQAALHEFETTGTTKAMDTERVEMRKKMDEWIANILPTLSVEHQELFHKEMKELRGKQEARQSNS